MPKKKKNTRKNADAQRTRKGWRVPSPLPGDDASLPENNSHLMALLKRFVEKEARLAGRKPGTAALKAEFDKAMDDYSRCYQEYVAALKAELPDQISDEALDRLDVIDMRGLDVTDDMSAEMAGLMNKYFDSLPHMGYASIPCFGSGILYPTSATGGLDRKIRFDVVSFDEDGDKKLVVMLQDFARMRGGVEWSPGLRFEAIIQAGFNDGTISSVIGIDEDAVETYARLYTKLPPERLGWTEAQCRMWERVTLQNAVDQAARFKRHGVSAAKELTQIFYVNVIMSNYFLSKFRPTKEVAPKKKPDESPGRTDFIRKPPRPVTPDEALEERIPPDKLVHRIGAVRFICGQKPAASCGATGKTPRNYAVPAWTTRGHTRTYKSGKTVYIKPSVRHRKALAGKDASVTPSVIEIGRKPDANGDGT